MCRFCTIPNGSAPCKDPQLGAMGMVMEAAKKHDAEVPKDIKKEWKFGAWSIQYECRSPKRFWGRFGGGWQWKLGAQGGGSSVIIFLLVSSIRIAKEKA